MRRTAVRNLTGLPILLASGPTAVMAHNVHGTAWWFLGLYIASMLGLALVYWLTYRYMRRSPLMRVQHGRFEYFGYGKRDYRSAALDDLAGARIVQAGGRIGSSTRLAFALRDGKHWDMALWDKDTSAEGVAAIRDFLDSTNLGSV